MFSHFDAQYFDDDYDTLVLNTSLNEDAPKQFLIVPSILAGILLGINNFLLGLISDIGLRAAYIFSLGAIIFTVNFRIVQMIQSKKLRGYYW